MTTALIISIHPPTSQFSRLQEFLGQASAELALFPPPVHFNRLMTVTQMSISQPLNFRLNATGQGKTTLGKGVLQTTHV